jgi:hypothetical protein
MATNVLAVSLRLVLRTNHTTPPRAAHASPVALGVTGTPTLIMLNRGTVSDVWVGTLPPEREAEVLSKL